MIEPYYAETQNIVLCKSWKFINTISEYNSKSNSNILLQNQTQAPVMNSNYLKYTQTFFNHHNNKLWKHKICFKIVGYISTIYFVIKKKE